MLRTVFGTFAAAAALGIGLAGTAVAAPVPVTAVNCDGDAGRCYADLQFGDGNWMAGWDATIQHGAARAAHAAAPVPARAVKCDGDTGRCTADLTFGDGHWKAGWDATIYHQATRAVAQASAGPALAGPASAAPVPMVALKCDGDTNTCTADLRFGDGNWAATWDVTVFHQ